MNAQISENTSALMSGVRAYIQSKPDIPHEGEILEIALGFVAAWRKGREAAASWLGGNREDNERHMAQVKSLLLMSKNYRAAMGRSDPEPDPLENAQFAPEAPAAPEPPKQAAPPPPEPPMEVVPEVPSKPAAPEKPDFSRARPSGDAPRQRIASAPAPASASEPKLSAPPPASPPPPAPKVAISPADLPKGVDIDVLDDVRRVRQCRQLFATTHQQIDVWEVFCLVMIDRDSTKIAVEELLKIQANGAGPEFMDGAMSLFEELLSIRAKYGKLAKMVREYIATIPIGSFGQETMDMALGFILASSRGRDRVKQWIEEPDAYRAEASGKLEDIISRTMNYETALRMTE